jgi:predicted HTH transcriptional regulator
VFKSELSSFFITLPNLQYVVKDVVKEQADILSIMAENPTVTAAELASMLGLTSRHIQRLIKDLVEKEIIRREGGRKLGKWIIL